MVVVENTDEFTWIQVQALPLTHGVTSIKSFNLSQPASSSVKSWWKDNRKYISWGGSECLTSSSGFYYLSSLEYTTKVVR